MSPIIQSLPHFSLDRMTGRKSMRIHHTILSTQSLFMAIHFSWGKLHHTKSCLRLLLRTSPYNQLISETLTSQAMSFRGEMCANRKHVRKSWTRRRPLRKGSVESKELDHFIPPPLFSSLGWREKAKSSWKRTHSTLRDEGVKFVNCFDEAALRVDMSSVVTGSRWHSNRRRFKQRTLTAATKIQQTLN